MCAPPLDRYSLLLPTVGLVFPTTSTSPTTDVTTFPGTWGVGFATGGVVVVPKSGTDAV